MSHQPCDTAPKRPLTWHRLWEAACSLQCKATVLVVALTLLVSACVSGYLLRSSVRLAHSQQNEQLVQLAARIALGAGEMLQAGDRQALEDLASGEAHSAPLVYVSITNLDGRTIAAARDREADWVDFLRLGETGRRALPGTPIRFKATPTNPPYLEVVYPVTVESTPTNFVNEKVPRLLGHVRAGMSVENWERELSRKVDLLIGLGILATAVAIPLGFLVVRRITAPLREVSDAMTRFSRGELHVRSPSRRNDEIGRLASVFNNMADEHQRAHERIVRMNAELEERVAQRTRQLRQLALRDPLTGLYNRRHFQEVLTRAFAESVRYDTDLSCLMMDLDHFKSVNDKFGHPTGDEVLLLISRTISSQLRSSDVGARFGGDEFVILMPQTNEEDARILAERIAGRFIEDLTEQWGEVQTTISIGIASVRSSGLSQADALVSAADRALYEAKKAGRNRTTTASSLGQATPA
ncbi:MAG: diguanylate cyclase [Phycisphaerales bacterium]|nr:MAG: diguanylate cyclase [Phycisphaerales bacterium]